MTCLYTNTATEDFVLDPVGPIVVVSPCSGHGFKFAPVIGRMAADLADGAAPVVVSRSRWRAGREGVQRLLGEAARDHRRQSVSSAPSKIESTRASTKYRDTGNSSA